MGHFLSRFSMNFLQLSSSHRRQSALGRCFNHIFNPLGVIKVTKFHIFHHNTKFFTSDRSFFPIRLFLSHPTCITEKRIFSVVKISSLSLERESVRVKEFEKSAQSNTFERDFINPWEILKAITEENSQ